MPKLFQSMHFNYSYNIWRFKFILNFLIHFYSQEPFSYVGPQIFLKILPFPHHKGFSHFNH
jgi:hypothetical protein